MSVPSVFGHLFGEPLGLLVHLVLTPRLAMLICIYGGESTALSITVVSLLELGGQVAIVALHHLVDGVRPGQVLLLSGDDVGMHMGHALAGVGAVLDGNVQGRGTEEALHGARDALHGQEEVLDLGGGQVMEARNDAARRDEDVARKQRLEIDQGEGQRCEVEDLGVCCRQPHRGVQDMATSWCVGGKAHLVGYHEGAELDRIGG